MLIKKAPAFLRAGALINYYSTIYGFKTERIVSMSFSAWMFKSIGLERSSEKIPMIDLASITYLPDTRSKSTSNFVISLTNDFTLSIEFNEICTVFNGLPPTIFFIYLF
jgi:hypothetical protein